MGAYVSVHECESHYNVTINCQHSDYDNETDTYRTLGGHAPREFPGNPDVAGIGVFIPQAITVLWRAIDVVWQMLKTCGYKKTRSEEEKLSQPDRVSVSDILESMVLSCSDQQVFTGAAYALTLRYWQGCTISAYHYNVVANMMLLSCATHLMSVTIVRNYWRYRVLAFLRVLCITGVFVVTGLLMVNQNADEAGSDMRFPTRVPDANATTSLLFLPAACFESARSPFAATFRNTTASADAFFLQTLRHSTPGNNRIHGWNWFIVLLLFYLVAGVAEVVRLVRRHKHGAGWRGRAHKRWSRVFKPRSRLRRAVAFGYLLYLTAGVAVSSVAMGKSAVYIFRLRDWVDRSGWIEDDNGINPENDWKSFGQLVPIFMTAMVFFAFLQLLSERLTQNKKHRHANDEKSTQNGTTIFYNDPTQQYALLDNNASSDNKFDASYYGVDQMSSPPAAHGSESSQASPFRVSTSSGSNDSTPRASNSAASTPQLPGLGLQNTSPLFGNGSSIVSGDGGGSCNATKTAHVSIQQRLLLYRGAGVSADPDAAGVIPAVEWDSRGIWCVLVSGRGEADVGWVLEVVSGWLEEFPTRSAG
ncbi:hypothetical protein PG994_002380 [Apiospora phragmitis]|uniref:Uncharacterized protein n=1 Tax=Apiospora phragmitis TaxID=2905665 RepID=A0ABR1WW97_9PEZI